MEFKIMVKFNPKTRYIYLVAAAITLWGSAQASAAQPSVCLFEDAGFDGIQLCSNGEKEVSAIRLDFNDKISSIQVSPGW
jgi:hypothetical protein